MLRRKFIQTLLIASSTISISSLDTVARASGAPSGPSAPSAPSAPSRSSGPSRSSTSSPSRYCSAGGTNCTDVSSDGLTTVDSSDLDDVLESFN
jgi:hypothetical protein